MLTIVLVCAFTSVASLGTLAMWPRDDTSALHRVAHLRNQTSRSETDLADETLQLSFGERVIGPMMQAFLTAVQRRAPTGLRERARQRLAAAGVDTEADKFLGKQVLSTLAFAVITGVLLLGELAKGQTLSFVLLVSVAAILGWRLPEFKVSRLISQRKKAMERALPEVLDVLSVSVEAGLGFDGAVQKVAERFPEPVAGEFRVYLREIRLGSSRADALRRLSSRSGFTDLQTFTAAVIQADQLGVSIAKVLRTQSEAMRIKRKQRAEEKAMQLPLKILFPLIMFIFPTLFIIILGPVAIGFLTSMTAP